MPSSHSWYNEHCVMMFPIDHLTLWWLSLQVLIDYLGCLDITYYVFNCFHRLLMLFVRSVTSSKHHIRLNTILVSYLICWTLPCSWVMTTCTVCLWIWNLAGPPSHKWPHLCLLLHHLPLLLVLPPDSGVAQQERFGWASEDRPPGAV